MANFSRDFDARNVANSVRFLAWLVREESRQESTLAATHALDNGAVRRLEVGAGVSLED